MVIDQIRGHSVIVRQNWLSSQFWSEFDEVYFIKSKFSSVSIKISRVDMDSAPSNSIGAPQLSKFDNYIIDFQNSDWIFAGFH